MPVQAHDDHAPSAPAKHGRQKGSAPGTLRQWQGPIAGFSAGFRVVAAARSSRAFRTRERRGESMFEQAAGPLLPPSQSPLSHGSSWLMMAEARCAGERRAERTLRTCGPTRGSTAPNGVRARPGVTLRDHCTVGRLRRAAVTAGWSRPAGVPITGRRLLVRWPETSPGLLGAVVFAAWWLSRCR
jgi:hypothetical protein